MRIGFFSVVRLIVRGKCGARSVQSASGSCYDYCGLVFMESKLHCNDILHVMMLLDLFMTNTEWSSRVLRNTTWQARNLETKRNIVTLDCWWERTNNGRKLNCKRIVARGRFLAKENKCIKCFTFDGFDSRQRLKIPPGSFVRKVGLLFARFYPGIVSRKTIRIDCSNDVRLERKTEISVTSRRLKFSKVGGGKTLHYRVTISTPHNTTSYPLRDSIYSRDRAYDYQVRESIAVAIKR